MDDIERLEAELAAMDPEARKIRKAELLKKLNDSWARAERFEEAKAELKKHHALILEHRKGADKEKKRIRDDADGWIAAAGVRLETAIQAARATADREIRDIEARHEKDIKPIEARDEAEVARYDIARKELCAVIETFPDEAERAELRAQVHRISEPRKDLARKRGKYDSRDVHQSSTQRTNKSL